MPITRAEALRRATEAHKEVPAAPPTTPTVGVSIQLTLEGRRLPADWEPRSAAQDADDTPFPGGPVTVKVQQTLTPFFSSRLQI